MENSMKSSGRFRRFFILILLFSVAVCRAAMTSGSAWTLYNQALSLAGQGERHQAYNRLQSLVGEYPAFLTAYLRLARLAEECGALNELSLGFQESSSPYASFGTGCILEVQSDWRGAAEVYARLIRQGLN